MTTFINSNGTETELEFEKSFKKGYIVMKMKDEKFNRGNYWEIPNSSIKELIENLEELI